MHADIIDDIKLLGDVRYSEVKSKGDNTQLRLLNREYFIDLVALLTFHSRAEFHQEKTELLKKRRQLFEEGDEGKYEDIVREIYIKQETIFN